MTADQNINNLVIKIHKLTEENKKLHKDLKIVICLLITMGFSLLLSILVGTLIAIAIVG